ncbi:hypothetical protein DID78_00005 [Candidatus Marinamargulisbacteria bacterium SCGC AG-343-D04]|nr:hypothetical protein DID78_00005 [Candidatus Marinamargulisbacteria bacterium SCGC AG-343-D04]
MWSDEDSYDGHWKNGEHSGQGLRIWTNGYSYDGRWEKNSPNGQGLMTYSNGGSYNGQWKNCQHNGQGIQKHPYGTYYLGTWKEDSLKSGEIGLFALGKKRPFIEVENGSFYPHQEAKDWGIILISLLLFLRILKILYDKQQQQQQQKQLLKTTASNRIKRAYKEYKNRELTYANEFIEKHKIEDPDLICPISRSLINQAVRFSAEPRFFYEKVYAEEWVARQLEADPERTTIISPMTGAQIAHHITDASFQYMVKKLNWVNEKKIIIEENLQQATELINDPEDSESGPEID